MHGVGLTTVGRLLGHSRRETTAQYADLVRDPQKAVAPAPETALTGDRRAGARPRHGRRRHAGAGHLGLRHTEDDWVDNGPEFISKALDLWAWLNGVTLDFSRPGKPTDNAFIESFNWSFRAEA